jgi:hypothetical protein
MFDVGFLTVDLADVFDYTDLEFLMRDASFGLSDFRSFGLPQKLLSLHLISHCLQQYQ